MTMTRTTLWTARAGAALAACLALPAAAQVGLPPSTVLLLPFDADNDGIITRAELDAGIEAEYRTADTNGDGCLDGEEIRAENDRRLEKAGAQATPVIDWNLSGCADAAEFGSAFRTYFDFVDRPRDGRLTRVELGGPAMPVAPPGQDNAIFTPERPPPNLPSGEDPFLGGY